MPLTVDDIKALWRARLFLALSLVAGAVVGFLLAIVLPKSYVSEVNVMVGRSFDQDIDNVYGLARYLESEAFRSRAAAAVGRDLPPSAIRATVIEGGTGPRQTASYLQVEAAGPTAAEAMRLAKFVLDDMVTRHRVLYDASIREFERHQSTIERELEQIKGDLLRMSETLQRFQNNPAVGAPSVLVMQAQVETRQSQLLQFSRELRDSRLQQAVKTHPTEAIGPPSAPDRPRFPIRSLFTAAGGLVGLLLAIAARTMNHA